MRGDVLDDGDGGQSGGELGEDVGEGFRAAGRGAEENDRAIVAALDGGQRGRAVGEWGRSRTRARGLACQGRGDGRRRGGGGRGKALAADFRDGGGLDFLDELRAEVAERVGVSGLTEDIDGADAEGFQCGLGASLGQGAHDDDRHGPVLHDEAQECEAIHPGHFDVEGDDIGLQAFDLVARDVGIDGGADHLDFRVGGEGVGDEFTHDGGVIDDENADFARQWGHGVQSGRR
ncbi:MAG: hypothetical protein BWX86_02448 [Verrucomicrobia bacterium ADurb.Bin122]|nr:MAG: hypothetical protein BWX86_02448 [Verrucomicrobia bacterium ADurb.Bin122]